MRDRWLEYGQVNVILVACALAAAVALALILWRLP